jgi:uncharacterized membrane protein
MDVDASSGEARERAPMASVLQRNIETLAGIRRQQERSKGLGERVADAITRFTGSLAFVYLHALLFTAWIVVNLGVVRGLRPFDPAPFTMLAMIASVEAIFLSTFVLISQNRMQASSMRRDELDVQLSLLSEHEVTRLIGMVEAVMKHLEVELPEPEELEELKRDVRPENVLPEIERVERHQAGRRG